jgi:predicted MFS family arabinose efflux permease
LTSPYTVLPVTYAVIGVLPVFLVSAQKVALDRDLGLSSARLGITIGATFAVIALAAPVLGRVLPAYRAPTCFRVSAALVALALALMAVTSAWWQILIFSAIAAIGNASSQISSNLALANGAAVRYQGLGFGIKQSSIPIASLLAGAAVPVIGSVLGWRATFLAGAMVALCLTAYRPPLEWNRAKREAQGRPRRLRNALLLLGAGAFVASCIGNSLPAFAVDAGVDTGFDENVAAALLVAASLASVCTRVTVGLLADRRSSSGLGEFTTLTACGAVALVGMHLSVGHGLAFALTLVLAFATAWGWAGLIYYAGTRLAPTQPGPVTGALISWISIGNIVGPMAAGFVIEATGYSHVWLLGAAGMVASTLLAASARRGARSL